MGVIRLRCVEGKLIGQILEFDGDQVLVGRGPDCDLSLDDDICSRRHARLEVRDGILVANDLQSTNGLYVNWRRVASQVLHPGDRVSLGRHVFEVIETGSATDTRSVELETELSADAIIEDYVHLDEIDRMIDSPSRPDADETADPVSAARKQLRKLHVAYRVCQEIASALDVESLYPLIVENLFSTFEDAERICLFIKHKGGALELVHNVSRHPEAIGEVSRSVLRRVEEESVGVLATDAASDDRFSHSHSVAIQGLRSLICAPLVTRGKFLGAIYMENCTKVACFTKSELELLTLIANQMAYAIDNAILYRDLQQAFFATIRSLGNALEAKDPYTRGHSARVAHYAVGIGEELGLGAEQVEGLRIAAELHDIGKIAISERIISKKGRLTEEEFEIIKEHPQRGVDILQPIRFLAPVLPFILYHHERFNGKGYPEGLVGEAIPLEARIINLADAFDAMTTQRSYNEPKSFATALAQCQSEAGVSFDAACVAAFERFLARTRSSAVAELNGREADLEHSLQG